MLQAFFHAWERRLASVTTDRVVRPFEWGLEWIHRNGEPDALRANSRTPTPGDDPADGAAFLGLARHVGHGRVLHAGPNERLSTSSRPPTEADS